MLTIHYRRSGLCEMTLPDILYKFVAPDGIVRTIQSLACSDGHEIAQPEVGISSIHAISSNAINVL
jgi:hypothetical protein